MSLATLAVLKEQEATASKALIIKRGLAQWGAIEPLAWADIAEGDGKVLLIEAPNLSSADVPWIH